jgi:hypothetical protein
MSSTLAFAIALLLASSASPAHALGVTNPFQCPNGSDDVSVNFVSVPGSDGGKYVSVVVNEQGAGGAAISNLKGAPFSNFCADAAVSCDGNFGVVFIGKDSKRAALDPIFVPCNTPGVESYLLPIKTQTLYKFSRKKISLLSNLAFIDTIIVVQYGDGTDRSVALFGDFAINFIGTNGANGRGTVVGKKTSPTVVSCPLN